MKRFHVCAPTTTVVDYIQDAGLLFLATFRRRKIPNINAFMVNGATLLSITNTRGCGANRVTKYPTICTTITTKVPNRSTNMRIAALDVVTLLNDVHPIQQPAPAKSNATNTMVPEKYP